MKSSAILKAVYKDCLDRGYVLIGDQLLPPAIAAARGLDKPKKKPRTKFVNKTGWIDDDRNIKNKAGHRDPFMMLVQQELKLDVWPEFYFSTERLYRFDYAIPVDADGKILKIAIEVNGGVWSKGNSGHSSGTGILRDYEKSNLAQSLGWKTIAVTPDQLISDYPTHLIKQYIANHPRI